MKINFLKIAFPILLIAGISINYAFNYLNCEGYAATKKGLKLELTEYDSKNKITGKTLSHVIDSKIIGKKTISTVKNEITDLKKNKTTESIFEIECDGSSTMLNTIKVLENNFKQSNQLGQSTASGNNPETPNELSVGQTLPEALINISIKGEINLESSVRLFERKVIAMEKVTVKAGTFDCAVITFTEDDKILFHKIKKFKVWLAKGIGTVKSEEYDKRGRLEKKVELTSIN